MNNQIPKKVLSRKAIAFTNCSLEEAFDYIASSEHLSEWLKKSGAIPGAKSVEIIQGPYDTPGAKRKVNFENGDSAIEELLTYHPPGNYSYKISQFSNFLGKLSDAAYGQLWFDNEGEQTRITWEYSFTYKNGLARIVLSLFLSLVYKRFMVSDLKLAASNLNQ